METLLRYWNRLPVVVRAVGLGLVMQVAGVALSGLPLLLNLRFGAAVPWSFPFVLLALWLFWRFAAGSGPPARLREGRSWLCRTDGTPHLPPQTLVVFVPAALVAFLGFRLLMPSIMHVSPSQSAIDMSAFPPLTVLVWLTGVSVSAGVTEEVAFRGYMQRPLEERFGVLPAALLVGVAFWVAHLNHAELTATHLPFHVMVSLVMGYLVAITRSLIPAIFVHALVDALLLPAYAFQKPAWVWDLLTASPAWQTGQWTAVLVLTPVVMLGLVVVVRVLRVLQGRSEQHRRVERQPDGA